MQPGFCGAPEEKRGVLVGESRWDSIMGGWRCSDMSLCCCRQQLPQKHSQSRYAQEHDPMGCRSHQWPGLCRIPLNPVDEPVMGPVMIVRLGFRRRCDCDIDERSAGPDPRCKPKDLRAGGIGHPTGLGCVRDRWLEEAMSSSQVPGSTRLPPRASISSRRALTLRESPRLRATARANSSFSRRWSPSVSGHPRMATEQQGWGWVEA